MRQLRVRCAALAAKLPKTRSAGLFAAALLAGAVLGPLTGIAVGEGANTTTVVTVTSPCASKTTTATTTVTVTTPTNTATTPTTTTGTTTTGSTTTGTGTDTTPTTTTGTTTTPTTTVVTSTTTTCACPKGTKTVANPTTATGTTPSTTTETPPTAPVTTTTSGTGGSGLGGTTTTTTTTGTTTTPAGPLCTSTKTVKVPPYVPPTNTAPAPAFIKVPKNNPFARHAMWIWILAATDRGNLAGIISQAKADGIGTLIIKNGDGRSPWPQFNKSLVKQVHAAGLKVCAWQYIYGNYPQTEAQVGAGAKADGADCLVIDAEVQYQGRYVAAQQYIKALRKRVGNAYPVALAGLPYIGLHTSFPYSVFLGPNGAQYNLPQMYWIDIGVSVPYVYQTTYSYNEIYQRPIFPLGQLYGDSSGSPTAASIGQFNQVAKDYKATGDGWWDFQSATSAWLWDTKFTSPPPAKFLPATNAATVVKGNTGDMVVWAQQHLDGAGAKLAVDGDFGPATLTAVESFQARHRLTVSGRVDGRTWDALLKYKPVNIAWSTRGRSVYSTIIRGGRPIRTVVALSARTRALAARREAR